jgi:hypothetical protein
MNEDSYQNYLPSWMEQAPPPLIVDNMDGADAPSGDNTLIQDDLDYADYDVVQFGN